MTDTTDFEERAIAFFRALRTIGKEILGHEAFGFKLDINITAPIDSKENLLLLHARVQETLTIASRTVQPVTIEGTTLQ